MNWLVWRQYRTQGAIALALLAAFTALALWQGLQVASQWHSLVATCAGNRGCLREGDLIRGVANGVPYLTLAVPIVLGALWGAPLVAGELESRTSDFAWAQSVTRVRWLAVKAGWLLLAAAACGGAVAALVTWWSGAENAQLGNTFISPQFDTQGIVPIGYAVFAMALGIAAGTVARRTLPAIAVVFAGFIGLRYVIDDFVRPHFMTAVTAYFNLTGSFTNPPGAMWMLSQGMVSPTGQVVSFAVPDLYGGTLPASCQNLLPPGGPVKGSSQSMNAVYSCLQAHGWRGFVTYQPAGRYWPFQGIETGIFLLLAAALIAVTFVIVRRRDA
jgi:hypothetical protein